MDEKSLQSIIENEGLQYYDAQAVSENGKNIYRVYITSKDGITLDDCAKINSIISPLFDVNPPIKGHYFLEISSPGVERKLKKPRHFIASIDENVKIKLINTDIIIGTLIDADKNGIKVQEDKEFIQIDYDEIDHARTYISW